VASLIAVKIPVEYGDCREKRLGTLGFLVMS
jgi:hypothetical protein